MTTVTQTAERTFNKNVKAQVLNLMPNAKSFKKSHVAGVGYVYLIKDANKNTLGKVFKEVNNGMKIFVD
jgi:hypothetical protein